MPEDRHTGGTAYRKWFRTALYRRAAEATRTVPTLYAGKVERIYVCKEERRRPTSDSPLFGLNIQPIILLYIYGTSDMKRYIWAGGASMSQKLIYFQLWT
jgi:hypothetical protein